MKQIITIIYLATLSLSVFPQTDKNYIDVMKKATDELYNASSLAELQAAGNTFERIRNVEKDQWHPGYYLAYTYIQMAIMTKEGSEIDRFLDKALDAINKAKSQQVKNSELLTLEGFLYMLRIPVDPAARGPQYSGLSFQSLQTALGIDPNNPRAHLVLANMQMGTARFFGQGLQESCETLNKSIQLFESQKYTHPLNPMWGVEWANTLLSECQ